MSMLAGPAVVGGLVVRNGKHRGTRVPLKLPVTVIGRGEGCDVRLNAEGIAPLHCVIAITPAGPTVRAWSSENTLVNGKQTAAAVLQHGDELKVGPCSFRVSWFGDLATAEPDESVLEDGTGPEWNLKEREAALNEQEVQLSTLLEGKQKQVHELLHQLADGREQFQAERATVKDDLAAAAKAKREANQLRNATEATRQSHHATYRKLIARAKRQRIEGKKELVAEQRDFKLKCAEFEKERIAFQAERVATIADAEKTKTRLQDGWQMLEEGQRRLLSDRKAAEVIFAEYQQTLDTRYAGIDAREKMAVDAQARMESRCAELLAEIGGLEQRAMNANLAVQELEQKRVLLEADGVPITTPSTAMATTVTSMAPVPLDGRRDRSFDELMSELLLRERDLSHEQKSVTVAKTNLVRLSNELTDQRAVLAEQFRKLAAAARLWQQAEVASAGELEHLAITVDAREQAIATREHRLMKSEETSRHRERELWAFRVKLEGWQAGLTAHESQWYAERDRTQSESDRTREHLAKWESSLETLCKTWNDLRSKERELVKAEMEKWTQERNDYLAARTALDAEKVQLAKQAKQCAALMAATEASAATIDEKKLRVMRKRWESHFTRFEKMWESRQKAVSKAVAGLDERFADLKRKSSTVAEQRSNLERETQAWDAKKLIAERMARENDGIYSLTMARAKRSDRELVELRSEVERVAATLFAAGQVSGEEALIALMPARAA